MSRDPAVCVVPRELTANERRILTVLSRYGPQTKRGLAQGTGVSWATVVKLVTRLEREKFLLRAGIDERPLVQGPDSALYSLTPDYPLAIGIDIEYEHTRVVVAGLGGRMHHLIQKETPAFAEISAVRDYCLSLVQQVYDEIGVEQEKIVGFGVAIHMLLAGPHPSMLHDLQAQLPEPW